MSTVRAAGTKGNTKEKLEAHAIILAGGRGTRFWPRSRIKTPKQLLNIAGEETMLAQTIERLAPLFTGDRIWVVTNREQASAVAKAARIPRSHILAEPNGRNTAAAIGLAATHLMSRGHGDALMAVLPADHYIAQPARYRRIVRAALETAKEPGALVVLGVPPTRPETGYGYVERVATRARRIGGESVYLLRRFTEKPPLAVAKRYMASGRHLWNAGMFFWRVSTYCANLERHLPKTHAGLLRIAETIGTSRYWPMVRRIYPTLENISVDYAVLEPASRDPKWSRVYVLPAEVGWSDIGSWAAVYELMARGPKHNVSAGRFLALGAAGNFVWSPKKFSAAVGVENLVIVETDDALLVCARDRAQEVGQVVKWLEAQRMRELL